MFLVSEDLSFFLTITRGNCPRTTAFRFTATFPQPGMYRVVVGLLSRGRHTAVDRARTVMVSAPGRVSPGWVPPS